MLEELASFMSVPVMQPGRRVQHPSMAQVAQLLCRDSSGLGNSWQQGKEAHQQAKSSSGLSPGRAGHHYLDPVSSWESFSGGLLLGEVW